MRHMAALSLSPPARPRAAPMTKYLASYAATVVALLAIDLVWLGVIAKPLYQAGIGHLMAAQPNLLAALLFYLLFPLGLLLFAVLPTAGIGWGRTLTTGALFGFFAYATYDLTNLATLKAWPIGLSLIDVAWGSLVSALACAAGKAVLDRF